MLSKIQIYSKQITLEQNNNNTKPIYLREQLSTSFANVISTNNGPTTGNHLTTKTYVDSLAFGGRYYFYNDYNKCGVRTNTTAITTPPIFNNSDKYDICKT